MLRTRRHREAYPREGAGRRVEVGLSFSFPAAPPTAVLHGDVSLDETLRRAAPDDPCAATAGALFRHLPGAVPSRVYIGSETCDRLLPSRRELEAWVAASSSSAWGLTLVLPPVGTEAQERALETVRVLTGVPGAEVVANDWGTVHRLTSRHAGLAIVLGRLTHKMLRDPRLAEHFDSPEAPAVARSALCRSGELAPGFRMLMDRYGLRRREIDPYLQPIGEEWEGREEKLSLHLPYLFVTMGRSCLPGAMHRGRTEQFVAGGPCRTECRRHAVEFRLPDPGGNGGGKRLLALGNGFYHAVSPDVMERILALLPARRQVDRIVVAVPAAGARSC
ncbi:MAG TPA: hypothetical protein VF847_00495 [Candidatus Deferrimicrobiaceae bacterium]